MTTQDIILLIDRIRLITRLCNGEYRGVERYYFSSLELLDTVSRLSDKGGFVDYLEAKGYTRTIEELHEALCGFLDSSTEHPSQGTPRRLSGMAKEQGTLYFYPDDEILFVLRMEGLIENCEAWLDILNQYTHKGARPGSKRKARRETETPAARKLAKPELQAVREKLVEAGLIVDGRWVESHALFKELVYCIHDQWDVENRGGYPWTPCALWVGYPTDKNSLKMAQNAGMSNPGDALGDIAENIRQICQKPTK